MSLALGMYPSRPSVMVPPLGDFRRLKTDTRVLESLNAFDKHVMRLEMVWPVLEIHPIITSPSSLSLGMI